MAAKKKKQPEKRDAMSLFGYRGGDDKPRKPEVITYDKKGKVLGDDGYEMTPIRKRMHRIFDGWFIYVIIMVVVALAGLIASYFQGAQYTDWELVQSGGNQFNGWDTAFLLRMEALLALYSAIFAALINVFGFQWFYDRKSPAVTYAMMVALALASVTYLFMGFAFVGTIEPLSLVNISFLLVTLLSMNAVKAERPTLRKPKVGKRVVK